MSTKSDPDRFEIKKQLLNATQDGDLQKTKELLSQFSWLEAMVPIHDGTSTWSQAAAAAGQIDLLKFWIERDQSRDTRARPSLNTLLYSAAGSKYIDSKKGDPVLVATYLLEKGANVDGDKKNYTPLHGAAFMNRPALIKLLIERGADLSRPYVTGMSALQIAMKNRKDDQCRRILEQAGAPLEVVLEPEPPAPMRTVDLRESAKKIEHAITSTIANFVQQHPQELITAFALASAAHEGYVMISFDTGQFQGSPWDATFSEFAYLHFPEWREAYQPDLMQVIDLDGQTYQGKPGSHTEKFMPMIILILEGLEEKGMFDSLNTTQECQIGIEMTLEGKGKFWKLKSRRPK